MCSGEFTPYFFVVITHIICDNYSDQLKAGHEYLGELSCAPNKELQELLNEFVQTYVFVPRPDRENEEPHIEELHKRRNFLAAYCKLIVYNIMPTKSGKLFH